MQKNVIKEKSYAFAVEIVYICRMLNECREYILSRQLLRSGTSIGANVRESVYGQTRADFIAKLSIALKEAHETEYWLYLLRDTGYLTAEQIRPLSALLCEIQALLIAILKTAKKNGSK